MIHSYEKIFKFLYPYYGWNQLLTTLLGKVLIVIQGRISPTVETLAYHHSGKSRNLIRQTPRQIAWTGKKNQKCNVGNFWNCINRQPVALMIASHGVKRFRLGKDIPSQKACSGSGYQAIACTLLVQTGRGISAEIADKVSSSHPFILSSDGLDERFCETSGKIALLSVAPESS